MAGEVGGERHEGQAWEPAYRTLKACTFPAPYFAFKKKKDAGRLKWARLGYQDRFMGSLQTPRTR